MCELGKKTFELFLKKGKKKKTERGIKKDRRKKRLEEAVEEMWRLGEKTDYMLA